MTWFWLRRLVRRHTSPIPMTTAEKWQRRLNFVYIFCAWNAFGLVVYYICTGRKDWAEYYGLKSKDDPPKPKALQWSEALGIKNAHVIHVSGLRKTGEYDIEDGQMTVERPKEEKID